MRWIEDSTFKLKRAVIFGVCSLFGGAILWGEPLYYSCECLLEGQYYEGWGHCGHLSIETLQIDSQGALVNDLCVSEKPKETEDLTREFRITDPICIEKNESDEDPENAVTILFPLKDITEETPFLVKTRVEINGATDIFEFKCVRSHP